MPAVLSQHRLDALPCKRAVNRHQIERFGAAVIDALAGEVAVLKPQIALFERFGPPALEGLARLTHCAREAGLLVLLGAKRGDIAGTGAGWAEAYRGGTAWLQADAVTVNP